MENFLHGCRDLAGIFTAFFNLAVRFVKLAVRFVKWIAPAVGVVLLILVVLYFGPKVIYFIGEVLFDIAHFFIRMVKRTCVRFCVRFKDTLVRKEQNEDKEN